MDVLHLLTKYLLHKGNIIFQDTIFHLRYLSKYNESGVAITYECPKCFKSVDSRFYDSDLYVMIIEGNAAYYQRK